MTDNSVYRESYEIIQKQSSSIRRLIRISQKQEGVNLALWIKTNNEAKGNVEEAEKLLERLPIKINQ